MDITRFFSPTALHVLRHEGLHKVAGAMHGCEEMTLKDGVAHLIERAYVKSAEARIIRDGIESLAVLRNEKTAEGVLTPAMISALFPALLGAGVGYASADQNDPDDPTKAHRAMITGGLIGGGAGILNSLRRIGVTNPGAAHAAGQAISQLR